MRVDPATFEPPYARDGDPWNFATSPYELERYATTMELVGRGHRRGFEPGCSVGVLTAQLAAVCDEVVAVDPSPSAIATARRRVDAFDHVGLSVGALPEWWPAGSFDLVVLSELGYYWDRVELAELVRRTADLLSSPGRLVAVHWLGHSDDHLLHGSEVHEVLGEVLGPPDDERRHEQFVAAVWHR
ncbi:MAG: NodS family protein [Ilumatobacteraceae bacterium]|jgi:SAM-dependent methyltransferase|nr:NodS family protein [Ilumatobacteraceae bacterium]